MFEEMVARRRRLRGLFGDYGQSLIEFLCFSGILLGSAGLLLDRHMLAGAPWGVSLPFVFILGAVLMEARRQHAKAAEPEREQPLYDWAAILWGIGCGVAGAAAFVIALNSITWEPPPNTVDSEIEIVQ